jgi:hypothetical protein
MKDWTNESAYRFIVFALSYIDCNNSEGQQYSVFW